MPQDTAPDAGLVGLEETPHTGEAIAEDGTLVEPQADDFGHAEQATSDPEWFKRAVFYEVLVRAFADSNGDGTGDLRGLADKLDYLQWLGVDCLWLPPFYRLPAARRRLRHQRLHARCCRSSAPSTTSSTSLEEAHKRDIRVIIDFVMNHTSDQHPWFQAVAQRPRRPLRRLLRVERRRPALRRRPHHLRRHRVVQLDLRPGARAVLLAPLLQPPARPQLREPRGPGGDARRPALLARPRHRRLPARRRALPLRGGGHQLREPPARRTSSSASAARRRRASYPGRVLLAEANQWPADVVDYFGDPEVGGDECHMASTSR